MDFSSTRLDGVLAWFPHISFSSCCIIEIIFYDPRRITMGYMLKVRGVRVRTGGHLKVPLLLIQTAAFIGATLCGIIYLHGYAVRLSSVW